MSSILTVPSSNAWPLLMLARLKRSLPREGNSISPDIDQLKITRNLIQIKCHAVQIGKAASLKRKSSLGSSPRRGTSNVVVAQRSLVTQ